MGRAVKAESIARVSQLQLALPRAQETASIGEKGVLVVGSLVAYETWDGHFGAC